MNEVLRLSDVSYTYKNSTQDKCAVSGLSLSIEKGSFVCILGSNGSGKSTLAKLLNGILSPTSGKIEKFEKTVSLVFQNPDNQIVASVVEEDTAFGPENLGMESSSIKDVVNTSLEEVSMAEHSKSEVNTLSEGQKQRVCIAGALAMKSRCIVLDEPCSMLDPCGKAEVMKVLKNLNKAGCTIIMITHDMDLAAESDRIILLSEGRIVKDDTPENVFSDKGILSKCSLKLSPALELKNYLRSLKK